MLLTNEDFEFLWNRDEAYKMACPTIDRIDNDGNYELQNCRFLERDENVERGHPARKLGQYKDGALVKVWDSISSAVKTLGLNYRHLYRSLKNPHMRTSGFFWKVIA